MEFYTSSSVEVENISMQDVFGHMERDVQTELEHFLQHTEKLDFEIRSAATPGAGVLSVAEHEDVHWLSGVENTNPNLLVNPRTALPVHEEAQKQRAALLRELSPKPSDSGPQLFVPSPAGRNSNKTESPQQLHLQPQVVSEENSPTKGSALYKVPVLVEHLKSAMQHGGTLPVFSCGNVGLHEDRAFPKPVYSYSCLIAMALKNSKTGSLPVSEIYTFMIENFPYFKTAPGGWKNSVRHNLSLNKCFEKVENPKLNGTRKGCLWALNPARVSKMEEEIAKWKKKDPIGIRNSMAQPEKLELIVQGQAGSPCPNRSTGPKPQQDHQVARSTTAGGIERSLVVQNTIKLEEVLGGSLKDVNSLDANHTLDPALSELALKNGLWDDDLGAELNLDLPVSSMSGSTNSISGSQINLCSSSLTGVKADSGFGQMMFSPLDLGSPSLYGQIPRTLSAQT